MSDYIKREDAVKAIRMIKNCVKLFEDSIEDAAVALNDLANTAGVVERKKGEWVWLGDCSNEGLYCSKCKSKIHETKTPKKKLSNFCPNCGADMREES